MKHLPISTWSHCFPADTPTIALFPLPSLLPLTYSKDWDTLKSHQDFIASPEYIPFTAQARHLFSSISFFHFLPTSALHHALPRATVTEVARFFNTSASFSARVQEFADRVEKGRPEGWKGIAHGVTVEDMARLVTRGGEEEENDGELELGGRGKKGHVLLIGWQSKEAHLRFKETALFKSIVGLLEKGNSGVEMVSAWSCEEGGKDNLLMCIVSC